MKAFIDCRMLGSGGIGTYLQSVLPYFIKHFECTLLLKQKYISHYKNNNIKIIECDITPFSVKELLFFPKKISKIINQNDFYYSPYFNIPFGIKIPIFTTVHDVIFLDVKNITSPLGTKIRKLLYQYAINKSSTIFTVSDFSAQRIKANLKLKNKPLVITYNAVPKWFLNNQNNSTQTSQNEDFCPNQNVKKNDNLLFVGNIKKHKGLHTLLQALKILRKKGFENKLIIVGNSENFRSKDDSIKNQFAEISNIEFTGKINDEQLKNLYYSSKLLVQPSIYEGFGMPPMEALTCKTNVVLSDIPVFKEIYKDFPVTYFECENPTDLAEKIEIALKKEPPSNLPNIYSFEKTANIIIKTTENEVKLI